MYLNKKIHFYITWGISFSSEMLNWHIKKTVIILKFWEKIKSKTPHWGFIVTHYEWLKMYFCQTKTSCIRRLRNTHLVVALFFGRLNHVINYFSWQWATSGLKSFVFILSTQDYDIKTACLQRQSYRKETRNETRLVFLIENLIKWRTYWFWVQFLTSQMFLLRKWPQHSQHASPFEFLISSFCNQKLEILDFFLITFFLKDVSCCLHSL